MHSIELEKHQQGTEEWKIARRKGIGGSDAAAAIGLSKYKSPFALWQEKRGEALEVDVNWFMLRGTALEPAIRQHYADTFGAVVMMPEAILRHPVYNWMIANLDGFTQDGERLFEAKTSTNGHGWGMPGTDEIPQEYLIQVQHSLAVTGLPIADIGVSIGGKEPIYYLVEANQELQQAIIEKESAFWQKVVDGTPPEPETIEDIVALHKKPLPGGVAATDEINELIAALANTKAQIKHFEGEKEIIEKQVKLFMGGYELLTNGSGEALATWKFTKEVEKFDKKGFQALYPEIYSQFVTSGDPQRRFLLK